MFFKVLPLKKNKSVYWMKKAKLLGRFFLKNLGSKDYSLGPVPQEKDLNAKLSG